MEILSKKLLFSENLKYKMYLLNGTNYIDVKDLGITEDIDPASCSGSFDYSTFGGTRDKYIINGKLYQYTLSGLNLVTLSTYTSSENNNPSGWQMINGDVGIKNGRLYVIDGSTAYEIHDSNSDWTNISPGYYSRPSSPYDYYSYAVRQNQLYLIQYSGTLASPTISLVTSLQSYSIKQIQGLRSVADGSGFLALTTSGELISNFGSWDIISGDYNISSISGCPAVQSNYTLCGLALTNDGTPLKTYSNKVQSLSGTGVTNIMGYYIDSYSSGYAISRSPYAFLDNYGYYYPGGQFSTNTKIIQGYENEFYGVTQNNGLVYIAAEQYSHAPIMTTLPLKNCVKLIGNNRSTFSHQSPTQYYCSSVICLTNY